MQNSFNIAVALCSVATGALGLYLQVAHPSIANPPEPDYLLGVADDRDQWAPLRPLPGRSRHRPRDLCDDLEAKLAAALAFAKTKLAVELDQEPAWQHFTAAVTAGADPLRRECAASANRPTPTTLPRSLGQIEWRLGATLAVAHAVRPAVDTLYDQLTPTQQDSLDELVERLQRYADRAR
jgi:hypothetical protein